MEFTAGGHSGYTTDYDLKESNGKWFVTNLRITSPDKKEVVAYGPNKDFPSQEEAKIAVKNFAWDEIDKDIEKRKGQERSK